MLEIPLQAVPSQITRVVLDGQNVQLAIYQKPEGLFVDINSGGVDINRGVLAHDANPLVCSAYLGFVGNLMFLDTQGNDDPDYTGIGARFGLIYLTQAEYDLLQ